MPWDTVKGIQKLHRPDGCAQTRQGVDINTCTQVLKTPETKMDKTKTKLEMHWLFKTYGVSVFGKERYSALKKITRDNPSQPLTLRPHLCLLPVQHPLNWPSLTAWEHSAHAPAVRAFKTVKKDQKAQLTPGNNAALRWASSPVIHQQHILTFSEPLTKYVHLASLWKHSTIESDSLWGSSEFWNSRFIDLPLLPRVAHKADTKSISPGFSNY